MGLTNHTITELLLAPRLPMNGAKVAIFSPSSSSLAQFPERTNRAKASLEEALNCDVLIPPASLEKRNYVSLSAQRAADELHRLATDCSIHMVMMAIGGYNTNRLLPFINFELLKRNAKIYCGYSDASTLLMAIYSSANLVTFHGPALLPQFGEIGGPFPETVDGLRRSVRGVIGEITPASSWTSERSNWNDKTGSERVRIRSEGWEIWREGACEGPCIGGNIASLNALIGTKWAPSTQGTIFFIEAVGDDAYLPRLDRALTHMRQAGWFDKIGGLIVGRSPEAIPIKKRTLKNVVMDAMEGLHVPIVAGIECGHVDPMVTIPIGGIGQLEVRRSISFKIISSGVQ